MKIIMTLFALLVWSCTPFFLYEIFIIIDWELFSSQTPFNEYHKIAWNQDLSVLAYVLSVLLLAFLVVRWLLIIPMRKRAIDVHDPDSEEHW